jgi:diguanylate cyclase (GGDEF)-like protein/PAS domain S-box-containing protein
LGSDREALLVSHLFDMMDRHQEISTLADEKNRLLMILQSMGDAVVCADAMREITFINAKAEALTGWSCEDAIGMPITSVLVLTKEYDPKASLDPARECIMSGTTQISERGTILTRRDGVQRYIGFSAAVIRSQAGNQQGAVLIINDISEVRAEEQEIARNANHDSLTGLPNRSSFLKAITDQIEQAKQFDRAHCLCFVDLDRFKQVNDTGGHAAGDEVLKEVARIIRNICMSDHMAARLGGDEFAVLMPNCDSPQAEWTANRIIRAIKNTEFRWSNRTYRVGASIGVTTINRDSPELSEILHQADMACYAAKERGRNRVSIYNGKRRTVIGSLSESARAGRT